MTEQKNISKNRHLGFWLLLPLLLLIAASPFFCISQWKAWNIFSFSVAMTCVIFCSFIALFLYDSRKFGWAGRGIAALIFLLFVGYLGHQIIYNPGSIQDSSRSSVSLANAAKGFFFLGLPALLYAIFGNALFQKKKNNFMPLRDKFLKEPPEKLGVKEFTEPTGICGVLMEIGFDIGSVTVFASLAGDGSIYFSRGGGVIGGIAHEAVRSASINLCRAAEKFINNYAITTAFPSPKAGEVIFYIMTRNGVLTASGMEKNMREGKHELSSLYLAGQEVVTQLRLMVQSGKAKQVN